MSFLLIALLSSLRLFASTLPVDIICLPKSCSQMESSLGGEVSNLAENEIHALLKTLSENEKIQKVRRVDKDGRVKLYVDYKKIIRKVKIEGLNLQIRGLIKKAGTLKEGKPFSSQEVSSYKRGLIAALRPEVASIPNLRISYKNINESEVDVIISGPLLPRYLISDIKTVPSVTQSDVLRILTSLKDRVFSKIEISESLEKIKERFARSGHVDTKIDYNYKILKSDKRMASVELTLTLNLSRPYLIEIFGLKRPYAEDLKIYLKRYFSGRPYEGDTIGLIAEVKSYLQTKGIEKSLIDARHVKTKDMKTAIFITVKETKRYKIKNVGFSGQKFISKADLETELKAKRSDIVDSSIFERDFFEEFKSDILKLYHERGLISASIVGPVLNLWEKEQLVSVDYSISEGEASYTSEIHFPKMSAEILAPIREALHNKERRRFNAIRVDDDIRLTISMAREAGHLEARIMSWPPSKIIKFSADQKQVDFHMPIAIGPRYYYNGHLIVGVKATRPIVVSREIDLKKGDIINDTKINDLRERLMGTGLFSVVKISTVKGIESEQRLQAKLLIYLEEKKFGAFQFSPGYRDGRGLKAAAGLYYNNLFGLNHTLNFKSEVSQRVETKEINDGLREAENYEFDIDLGYGVPYWGKVAIDFGSNLSFLRRKYLNFDADILRGSVEVSHRFNRVVGAALNYKIEQIRQFNATLEKDEDRFRIGSFSPSIYLDFRDSATVPRKGLFLGLSYERAAPWLLSMDREDFSIDFYKVVARARGYIPYKKWVFASSYAFGVQKNLERSLYKGEMRGKIPAIKAFRLAGEDTLRGFNDLEAARIHGSDQTIDDITINDKAFFGLFKFEPRYFIDNQFIISVFYEAGGLYYRSFKLKGLRSTVGAGVKLVTPVGTIDLDYGMKLRAKTVNGRREDIGRIHFSIGSF